MPLPLSYRLLALSNWRQRSLVRSNALVFLALLLAFYLSDFPRNHGSLLLLIPLLMAIAGTLDTLRCMRSRWNWYHGGVILCAYMDLMIVCLILFFLIYPLWL